MISFSFNKATFRFQYKVNEVSEGWRAFMRYKTNYECQINIILATSFSLTPVVIVVVFR